MWDPGFDPGTKREPLMEKSGKIWIKSLVLSIVPMLIS